MVWPHVRMLLSDSVVAKQQQFRKPNCLHSYLEMRSKQENYLRSSKVNQSRSMLKCTRTSWGNRILVTLFFSDFFHICSCWQLGYWEPWAGLSPNVWPQWELWCKVHRWSWGQSVGGGGAFYLCPGWWNSESRGELPPSYRHHVWNLILLNVSEL